ncbi:HK97 gp10 family phage protein [Lysinibacillus xylanilyticus]|uniref:HK97 gp10 family phage protein n=1 Tax=Lysinibacillus xylanilyticus TaxID=582475 RepID=UPI0038040DC2
MATNINDFAAQINRTLANYAHGVGEEIEKVAEKVAKEGAQQLKARSPVGMRHRYAKGWRAKKVGKQWVVHNTEYQLTHLLEKGHAKVGGGRVPAKVHIAPVEEDMIDKFIKGVEEAIRG